MKIQNLGGVWFDYFMFSFSLEIENGDENMFGWISIFIFSENIFPNEPKKLETIKSHFQLKSETSFWIK